MSDDEPTAEELEAFGKKAVRLMRLHVGLVPITEYTQWDFDQMLGAAMRRAEPDDDDWEPDPA
jgi:hypothetical protein